MKRGRTSLALPALDSTRRLLAALFGPPAERHFAVRYWEGTVDTPEGVEPRFTLVLLRPGALRRMLLPPSELSLAHAYMFGDVDYEGDLEAVVDIVQGAVARGAPGGGVVRLLPLLLGLPREPVPPDVAEASSGRQLRRGRWAGRRSSPMRDAAAVRFHYDVGNDFFALWLDRRMVYSCGYFPRGTEDLDAAQEAKLEFICRKLRLQPGERLLDMGCGWGGLIQYAAERYGVEVVGITLSEEQAKLARARIEAAGLGDRCRVEVCDYRSVSDPNGFDKISSIGMVEHVGSDGLPAYFGAGYRLLRPRGLMLNHGIISLEAARSRTRSFSKWLARRVWHRGGGFSDTYVWPDVRLLTTADFVAHAEAVGFETRDLESLREHYLWTVRHWLQRIERRHDEVAAMVGEATYRVWRLYTAAAAHRLASAQIGVVQTLLAKPDARGRSSVPRSRADLYRKH
jgi:cyclopropane-fatty-acyl-phospholipid synthase